MRDHRAGDGDVAARLLVWYDRHARVLPWRVPPGGTGADPYRVWLSEIMLQQTTVAAVRGYFDRFTALWPDVQALARADEARVMAEWAGLGYYARARNLVACARAVAAAGGFPDTREGLAALPGIGAYTSAAIAAIAFGRAETVVDGNVERVVARLFAVQTPLPAARRELTALAATLTPADRPGDFAQAMMDLGATICTPRRPACGICPLTQICAARAQGIAADLPRRAPKAPRPVRTGTAWVALDATGVLVERRPARGLLGGTLAFPSTGWDGSELPPPQDGGWQALGEVRHVFTHFELRLTVLRARLRNPARGEVVSREGFDPLTLPGLMRKVWALAE
nr:A/G-specific adenine glycosylase [Paracoccus luteus]